MKALWKKYFHIPTDAPMGDRVFLCRFTLDICLILLYLLCIAYSAYALFRVGNSAVC